MANKKEMNTEKLKEAILFFIRKVNNPTLGKTKLFKLLYFADSRYYLKTGHTITGEKYVKYDNGPIPSHGDQILSYMKRNDLKILKRKFGYRTKFHFFPNREPNLSVFTEEELKILEAVAKRFMFTSTDKIIKISHRELPWKIAENNHYLNLDLLPYQFEKDTEEPEDEILRNSIEFKKAIGNIIHRIEMGERV